MGDYESTDKMEWFVRKMSSGWFSRKELLALAAAEFPSIARDKLSGTFGQYWSDSVNPKWPTYKAILGHGLKVISNTSGQRHLVKDASNSSRPPTTVRAPLVKKLPKQQAKFNTQWAAQFLVASELTRRGYDVAFTMGNCTPVADLMVGSPTSGKQFWIDVKGLSSKTAWLVRPKSERPELYYVLVYLGPPAMPSRSSQTDAIFILTQAEIKALLNDYANRHPGDKGKMPGFGFKDPVRFEDAWDKLPL